MSRGAPAYYDAEAEAAVIGACLVYRAALGTALDMLTAADFGAPSHRHIWQAIESLAATGTAVEPSTVANELRRLGLTEHVDMPQLATLAIDAPGAASVGRHAETVATHALRRRIVAEAHALAAKAEDLTVDPGDALDAHKARLEEIDSPVLGRSPGDELAEEFVERVRNQAPASWVVPDCITDDTRVAIVAPEGVGKTELIRQILVCVAYGLHPFTFEPIPAQPTLLLDLENPEQNVAERVGALIELAKAQNRLGPRRGTADDIIWHRPTGIDLRKRSDRVAFEDVLRRRRPKLVGICPIYTAYTRAANESDEMVAQSVVAILNNLRKRYGFGLLLEMHAPHGEDLQHRVLRPIGSSLWMRWPELGRKLMPKDGEDPFMPQTVVLGRFRGDRLQVNWPDELRRGRDWPWMGEWTTKRPPKARAVRPKDEDEEPF